MGFITFDGVELGGGAGSSPGSGGPLLTDIFNVADEAAMLALTSPPVNQGDFAIQTDPDPNEIYVFLGGDPSDINNWSRTGQIGPGMSFLGDWDAGGSTLPAGPDVGDMYRISGDGTVSGVPYEEDDVIMWVGAFWYIFRKVFSDGEAPLNIEPLAARPGAPVQYDWWVLVPAVGPDAGKTFFEWFDGATVHSVEATAIT